MKDFDPWNSKKKNIHAQERKYLYFREREVWWCSLGTNVGFEQDGKGKDFTRPVVVLRKFNEYGFLGVPLTTSTKLSKYRFDIGDVTGKTASALLSQLRFIDSKRLVKRICVLDKIIFETLKKATQEINFPA